MDGAQFAKMLSDKHLFELNRMEYKYSTVSVKEFAELLRQNFAQPLPLTDFSGNKLFYLPNLAQISTNGMKQLLSVPVSGQNFGLSAMTEKFMLRFKLKVSARPAAVSVISSMVMPLVMNKKPASMV